MSTSRKTGQRLEAAITDQAIQNRHITLMISDFGLPVLPSKTIKRLCYRQKWSPDARGWQFTQGQLTLRQPSWRQRWPKSFLDWRTFALSVLTVQWCKRELYNQSLANYSHRQEGRSWEESKRIPLPVQWESGTKTVESQNETSWKGGTEVILINTLLKAMLNYSRLLQTLSSWILNISKCTLVEGKGHYGNR